MIINSRAGRFFAHTALMAALFMGSGCSLMHEDLPECAVKQNIHAQAAFIFDYNTSVTDLFDSQVGAVTLYIFDSQGRLVSQTEATNHSISSKSETRTSALNINLDTNLLTEGETYSCYAVGHEHPGDYASLLNTPGAHFLRPAVTPGQHSLIDFYMKLERDENLLVNHSGTKPLHYWATLRRVELTIPAVKEPEEGEAQQPDVELNIEVPLIKITNELTVTFSLPDFPEALNPADFDIYIEDTDGGAHLDMLGNSLGDNTLRYTPYQVLLNTPAPGSAEDPTVSARFGISRLFGGGSMRLVVYDRERDRTTIIPNLPALLAKGREAYPSYNWSTQEYLDRQDKHDINFELGYPVPRWVSVNIDILSWRKRVQLTDL